MKFEVYRGYDNRCMMSTKCESCIPYEHVSSMEKAGYYFKIDGKRFNAKQVLQRQKTIKQSDVEMSDEVTPKIEKVADTKLSKRVRCIDTGEEFDNQSQAARHFGIDPAQVSDSIKTGRPRSGYRFERI